MILIFKIDNKILTVKLLISPENNEQTTTLKRD